MKFQHPFARRLAGFSVATLVRSWMASLDFKAALYDETVDPARRDFQGPNLYIFWHENLVTPFFLRGHCRVAMLLSQHRDADWLAEAADFMGFGVIRGSTTRGGQAAIRQMTRQAGRMNLAITPDGPRGPRRVLAPGAIYLASRMQIPLVAFGVGYDRPWRMPTWDRFAVPRPFSRCRMVLGPRMLLPRELDRDGVEHYRQRVERLLDLVTLESAAWAEAGTPKLNQIPVRREAASLENEWNRAEHPSMGEPTSASTTPAGNSRQNVLPKAA